VLRVRPVADVWRIPAGRLRYAKQSSIHCYRGRRKEGRFTMSEETKTAQVNLRLQPSLKSAAEKAAADDSRSLTSLIEKLLTDYLRKKGFLK
jgi:hypothetical protein